MTGAGDLVILKYSALASVVFAGLFAVFVILRAETGSPCPYDALFYNDPYEPERVVSIHPPPFGTPASRPLSECASVVVLENGTAAAEARWLEQVQLAFQLESANHGMNAAVVAPFERRSDAVLVGYTTYCKHRSAMTAWLIEAFTHRFPEGPRLRDATGEVDLVAFDAPHHQSLWPGTASE